MHPASFAVGQIVELNDGRPATVRFQGATAFAPGTWIGIELEAPTGKNDGSVKGDCYFECAANHGMFLRASGISKILDEPTPRARPVGRASANGPATGNSRPNITGVASPGRGSGFSSPARSVSTQASEVPSPTKQLLSRTNSPSSAASRPASLRPRSSLAPSVAVDRRTPTLAPVTHKSRTSSRPSANGHAPGSGGSVVPRPSSQASAWQSTAPEQAASTDTRSISGQRLSGQHEEGTIEKDPSVQLPDTSSSTVPPSAADEAAAPEEHDWRAGQDTVPDLPASIASTAMTAMGPPAARRAPSPATSIRSQQSIRASGPSARAVEDLQSKLRLLERKRLEDREKLKALDRVTSERDRAREIIEKLQKKYQPQQQELIDLKKQLSSVQSRSVDTERIQSEHDAELENAALDREMAEEQYEVLKTEVEALREKNEEMTLELEVLREENEELSKEMSPEERTSQGWLQLERSNERLREALLKLRDMGQEQEQDLKGQIKVLKKDAEQLDSIKEESARVQERLVQSEAAIEDLKQQLEAAQGGEDMIEELTERNMEQQERLDELKAAIDDLENLRELTDELEVNHVEAEKQMQEEIDFKDSLISDHLRRSSDQQKNIDDYEITVARFREAFRTLQADLEDMRASQQITEAEAEDLNSKSRSLLDLNMKLQNSAMKTQVKAIDLELRRLEASEAAEHLAIVQRFLPEAFQAERDSILALLRFKRIVFKADLVHGIVKEKINGRDLSAVDDEIFSACSILDALVWISSMSDRFARDMSTCSVDVFASYQGALYDLEPVERALNVLIEDLKKDELGGKRTNEELQRSKAVMSHLASLLLKESLSANVDRALMQTSMMQSNLETTASALSLCRPLFDVKQPTLGESDEAGVSLLTSLDAIISQVRGAKVVAGKAHRNLTDLRSRSLGLGGSLLDTFTSAEAGADKLAVFGRTFGQKSLLLIADSHSTTAVSADLIMSTVATCVRDTFGVHVTDSEPLPSVTAQVRAVADQVAHVAALCADLGNAVEFDTPTAPWVLRSAEIKAGKTSDAASEAEVVRLTEALRERDRLVRAKAQELEEQGVRIEVLDARSKEATKRSAQLAELESSLRDLRVGERKARDEAEKHARDAARLRLERDSHRRREEELKGKNVSERDKAAGLLGTASKLELDRSKLQITSLQAAIRYLREENERLQRPAASGSALAGSAANSLDWLHDPLIPPPSARLQTQSLVQKEGKDALLELLHMAVRAEPVDLKRLPANKLGWRPVKETSAWAVQWRREEWETWREWKDNVVRKGSAALQSGRLPTRMGMVGAVKTAGAKQSGARVGIVAEGDDTVI